MSTIKKHEDIRSHFKHTAFNFTSVEDEDDMHEFTTKRCLNKNYKKQSAGIRHKLKSTNGWI